MVQKFEKFYIWFFNIQLKIWIKLYQYSISEPVQYLEPSISTTWPKNPKLVALDY